MRRLPRPLNHGATLFLVALVVGLASLGMLAVNVGELEPYNPLCTAAAPPDLMVGLLCSGLTLVATVLPMWLIFPPSRPALEQDEDGLTWDRPALPGGEKLLIVTLLTIGIGLGIATATTRQIHWRPATQQVGTCGPTPPWVQRSIEVRRSKGLGVATVYAGLLLLTGWLVRRRWRRAGRLELDERGLVLDEERYAYKDLTRIELGEGGLVLATHDGRHAHIGLFPAEVPFAQQLVALVVARLPAETEDRSEAQRALLGLTERTS